MKRTKPHQKTVSTQSRALSTQTGQIISAHGRHYFVELENGEVIKCFPRGKRGGLCVGDWVEISTQGERAAIEQRHERKNLLYRSDEMRTKQFAANIDQLFIVLAAEPMFSEDLTGRALVAARCADIEPIIILNKADLPSVALARQRLQPLAALGVPIKEISALDPDALHEQLLPLLRDKTTLLLGQSGMGKSTILNALVPEANAHTQAHSAALGTGRHTTTSTKLYHIPNHSGKIIDSPGFQAFGLAHLEAADIIRGFVEFHEPLQNCKFYNCSHRHEPGCGVVAALDQGLIHPDRYQLYLRLLAELENQSKY
ncbi:ribosome small subunit-dependent GTPase A [Paenalcaligenes sp.]|uniref:ribosome small subunit-dependent GTPase A n=1 Tax=Paenalcaligenes sp. TaxID=1966342 RepID=UPI002603297D|nr:ribosome small subunit-dependent GTPase A [Paenalcaligenes sp.]